MCGIAGFLGSNIDPNVTLGNMINAINHRGPDDKGVWFDKNDGIGFAHSTNARAVLARPLRGRAQRN